MPGLGFRSLPRRSSVGEAPVPHDHLVPSSRPEPGEPRGSLRGSAGGSPLTELGRLQALVAAAALPSATSWIVCSPLGRATGPAELIHDELGIENRSRSTNDSLDTIWETQPVSRNGPSPPGKWWSCMAPRIRTPSTPTCSRPSVISARGRPTVWSFHTRALPGSSSLGGQLLHPPSSREAGTLANGELMQLRCTG